MNQSQDLEPTFTPVEFKGKYHCSFNVKTGRTTIFCQRSNKEKGGNIFKKESGEMLEEDLTKLACANISLNADRKTFYMVATCLKI